MFMFAFAFMLFCTWVVRARPDLALDATNFFDGFLLHAVVPEQHLRTTLPFGLPRPSKASPAQRPTQRKRLTPFQKKKVGALAQWRCQICGGVLDESYEVDHILPVSQKGTNHISNLRALCRGCHGKVSMAVYIQ